MDQRPKVWKEFQATNWDPINDNSDSNSNIYSECFNYLENFAFPHSSNTHLNGFNPVNTVRFCPKEFRKGELGYTCLECGNMNNISILCPECFQNSNHKNHKYRIEILPGRHFCMCGHEEVWKKFSSCKLHKLEGDSKNMSLPQELLDRSRLVFAHVLKYAQDILTYHSDLDEHESPRRRSEFVVTLSTNLTSTRILMIELFQKFLPKCSKLQATSLAKNFSQNGRVVIEFVSLAYCSTFTSEMERILASKPSLVFQISITTVAQILKQEFVLSLLSRLEILLAHEDFRAIFSQSMVLPQKEGPSILEYLIKHESVLWLQANKKFQKLMMLAMMDDSQGKIAVATVIIKNFEHILDNFGKHFSCNSFYFTFKLFYYPEVANFLIANEDALFVIGNLLVAETSKQLNEDGKFDGLTLSLEFLLMSFNQLLSTKPTIWTEHLRDGFLRGLVAYLNSLELIQDMDSMIRNTGDHVLLETNSGGILIYGYISRCSSILLEWCSTDREVLAKAYRATLNTLEHKWDQDRASSKPADSVSIHAPLSRFLAGLHLRLVKFNLPFPCSKLTVPQLIEPTLKIQVMITEAEMGMWVRNGEVIQNLITFYRGNGGNLLDGDIQLLQISASITVGNEFVVRLLGKFWPSITNNENTARIYENLLRLLINIIGERCLPEMSNVEPNDPVKREIIHLLCLKPSNHSGLMKEVLKHHTDITLNEFDKIIDEITVFKKIGNNPGVYELRSEFLEQYDPFFLHYVGDELFSSYKMQCQKRKLKFCPPPNLPKLKKSFHGIVGLLQVEAMHQFLENMFKQFVHWQENGTTELMLHETLHLIGLALQEEQSGDYPFLKFTGKAKKWNLVKYLENLLRNSHAENYHDMVKWTLSKYKEVAKENTLMELMPPPYAALEEQKKQEKLKLVAERRAKISKEMKMAQYKFLEENQTENMEASFSGTKMEESYTCIICQETEPFTETSDFLLPALVQKSAVFCTKTLENRFDYPIFNTTHSFVPHTKTCPHVMHKTCWMRYSDGWNRERTLFSDFVCPLCGLFRNTVLPLFPKIFSPDSETDFSAWLAYVSDPKIYESNVLAFMNTATTDKSELLKEIKQHYNNFDDLQSLDHSVICQSLAYTLHSIEVSLRDSNKPLLGHLTSSDEMYLKVFIRIFFQMKKQNLSYYHYIENFFHYSIFIMGSESFNVLLDLIFSGPSSITMSPNFIHCILIGHIIKILSGSNFETEKNLTTNSESPVIHILSLMFKNTNGLDEDKVWCYVQEASLPFLRCSVLLYQYASEGPLPTCLTEVGGDTFSNMCSFLGLPQTQQDIFGCEGISELVKNWCNLFSYNMRITQPLSKSTKLLIELPEDYNDLVRRSADFTCSSKRRSKHANLCLICGEMVCSAGFCCKTYLDGVVAGGCYYHTSKCGRSVGIFLSINTFKVLLMSYDRGIVWLLPPYVDSYGESELTYNYPLRFCPTKYASLNKLWLNHQILEEISRHNPSRNHFHF